MSIVLASPWTPRGELERFRHYHSRLMEIYNDIVIALPEDAISEDIAAALDTLSGVEYITFSEGSGRHKAIETALNKPVAYIHYVDFDRAIRWVETRPDELAATVKHIQTTDCLITGRTPDAYATHPDALRSTETILNTSFTEMFRDLAAGTVDFCAGSRGFSRAAAAVILENDPPETALSMDVGWAILLKRGGFQLDYIEVAGLDWESADQYQPRAADREAQRRAAEAYDQNPDHWALRVWVAQTITDYGIKALNQPLREVNHASD